MNNLPQEMVDRISSFLPIEDLKNTLLLSRPFQYAAERHSETFEVFNLTPGNAEKNSREYTTVIAYAIFAK